MAKYDKVISPGQEGTIEMAIDGNKVHGKFSKAATIHCNDPDRSVMTITISGEVVPYLDVLPSTRIYLKGRYGEQVMKTVTLVSNEEGRELKITKVESNIDDKITYKVEPGDQEGEFKLKVWKNPKLPTLNTYGSLFVYTNSEYSPMKTLQVNVTTKLLNPEHKDRKQPDGRH